MPLAADECSHVDFITVLSNIPLSRPDIIAIDGPVATGKSVVGRLLAQHLGYRFLDTGSMYRALSWLAINDCVNIEDEESLIRLCANTTIGIGEPGDQVFVNGKLAPLEDYREEIEKTVSLVARIPEVRQAMVDQQRKLADAGKMVMVGRDIGTVVVPDASLKLYFLAPTTERAKRRFLELKAQGYNISLENVLDSISKRDKLDSERTHSPLQPAEDAMLIDTEGLTVKQVEGRIFKFIESGS